MVQNGRNGPTEHKCCGILEEAAAKSLERRSKRREKPQPWIVLKTAVGITAAIITYAFYVYIGRFCVPMIKDNDGVLGGRKIGIPFVAVFSFLGVMLWWTYAKVVFTGPGKARDFIEKSRPPVVNNPLPRWWDSTSDIGAGPYVPATPLNGSNIFPPSEGSQESGRPSPRNSGPESLRQDNRKSEVDRSTKAIPSAQVAHTRSPANRNGIPPENGNHTPRDLPPMMFTRRPSTTPVLLPEFRYCHKDEFVRPMRAHHCRACGTCILKYDHHCPWIGQCVGAHNHKFFVNFLQWALLFCSWTFATLLVATVKSNSNPNRDIDPQQVVVIALAGLFTLFSGVLLVTHIRLILLNLSTLESLGVARMEEREKAVLARLHSCYEIRAKRGTRKLWDEEWGSIITDGNLWSLGKYSHNWEAVMGHKLYEWFLPVGHSDGDGLTYPTNPRFDKEGRWRPRREWPAELR